MKKWIIGSLVGAIIIFVWQAASWQFIGIHEKAFKYHPAQTQILTDLNNSEEGSYMLPYSENKADRNKVMNDNKGQPWASVIYHKSMNPDMTMGLIRCFLVDFFLVISLIYILTRGGTPIARRVFAGAVAMGLFSWLWTFYMGHIFFALPWSMITGDLIDSVVAWGLCGLWIGWWINRQPKVTPTT